MKLSLSTFLLVLSTSLALKHSSHDAIHIQRELKNRKVDTHKESHSSKVPKATNFPNRNLKEKKTEIISISSADEKTPDNVGEMTNAKSSKAPKRTKEERFLKILPKKGKTLKKWKSSKAPKTSTKPPRMKKGLKV
jgi:hypothetical protein